MMRIAPNVGTSGAPPSNNNSTQDPIDAKILQLENKKALLQSQVNVAEARAKQCYNAIAGPGKTDYLPGSGLNGALKETAQIMADWAMGPGAGNPAEGADYKKKEIEDIDNQIAALQAQKQQGQQNQNQNQGNNNTSGGSNATGNNGTGSNGSNNNNSKVNELKNEVQNLTVEKNKADAQKNYTKEKQLQNEIDNLNVQIAAMRGGNEATAAA